MDRGKGVHSVALGTGGFVSTFSSGVKSGFTELGSKDCEKDEGFSVSSFPLGG